jgi:hypothetical protein
MSTDVAPVRSLPDLAQRINVEHAACMAAAQDAISRAIEVGRLLVEAKGQVKHGEWTPWIEKHCPFGDREAQHYMKVYKGRHQIRNGVSDLTSLRGAIAILAEPKSESADSEKLERCEEIIERELSELKGLVFPTEPDGEVNVLLGEVLASVNSEDWPPGETDKEKIRECQRVSALASRIQVGAAEQTIRAERALGELLGDSGKPAESVPERPRPVPNPVRSSDLLSGDMWVTLTDPGGSISLGVRAANGVAEAILNLDAAKELRRMLDEAIAHESGGK